MNEGASRDCSLSIDQSETSAKYCRHARCRVVDVLEMERRKGEDSRKEESRCRVSVLKRVESSGEAKKREEEYKQGGNGMREKRRCV